MLEGRPARGFGVSIEHRWLSADTTDARVERLIEAIAGQQLDAVTFTSAPAVHALFSTAEALGRLNEAAEGFR
ncbi:hypothetical protein [Cryobacterium arcticum]|uniref:Uncharacterized protein n=1 Tax=Cryobacterium arcticum TaxID=670052 RepID=A0A1B1BI50_9MICO|nr:hypothetical protein [Cryobacterium arcticum]ANP72188.1 hypothetical protein PA27867_1222 [Cryobacterium arcticum]